MIKELRPAIVLLLAFTVITGLIYPAFITLIAQTVFPHQAGGSLMTVNGKVIGSELIGQAFTSDKYFHSRPSAIGSTPYDATNSSGSNYGPTSKALISRVQGDAAKLKAQNPGTPIPVDLVTTSASGLDPDITPEGAAFQIPRVAKARKMTQDQVAALVAQATTQRSMGMLGEPRVNVLKLNLLLDAAGK